MIPASFEYRRAGSATEAVELLAGNDDARLLAGGHSLLPMMKMRLAAPALLIDIGGIEELRGIRRDGDDLVVGALATHAEIAGSAELGGTHRALAEAAAAIGDVQVRNCGTLGGSLAHADPAADYAAAVLALDAVIEVLGPGGERTIPAAELFAGLLTTTLAEAEIVTAVRFPSLLGAGSAYVKIKQPASGFAIVGVAAVIDRDGDTCTLARLGATGIADAPQRLAGAEQALQGSTLNDGAFAAARAAAGDGLQEVRADLYADEAYRRHLLGVVTARAARRAAS
jgi:carbon-monoxide dehydrogenase medium subunit